MLAHGFDEQYMFYILVISIIISTSIMIKQHGTYFAWLDNYNYYIPGIARFESQLSFIFILFFLRHSLWLFIVFFGKSLFVKLCEVCFRDCVLGLIIYNSVPISVGKVRSHVFLHPFFKIIMLSKLEKPMPFIHFAS